MNLYILRHQVCFSHQSINGNSQVIAVNLISSSVKKTAISQGFLVGVWAITIELAQLIEEGGANLEQISENAGVVTPPLCTL